MKSLLQIPSHNQDAAKCPIALQNRIAVIVHYTCCKKEEGLQVCQQLILQNGKLLFAQACASSAHSPPLVMLEALEQHITYS